MVEKRTRKVTVLEPLHADSDLRLVVDQTASTRNVKAFQDPRQAEAYAKERAAAVGRPVLVFMLAAQYGQTVAEIPVPDAKIARSTNAEE